MRALRAYFLFLEWRGAIISLSQLFLFLFTSFISFTLLFQRYYICEMKLEKSFKLKSNWNYMWIWNFHFLSISLNILKYENLNEALNFTVYFKLNEYERLCDIYKLKYFENLNEIERFIDIRKLTCFLQFEIIWDI